MLHQKLWENCDKITLLVLMSSRRSYILSKLSYYKLWDAKQKAIAKIFGDWEESYQRLRKLLLAYLDQDLGT